MIEFKEWPKTPRLFRDMIVTEKIDGTNAAVVIEPYTDDHETTVRTGGAVRTNDCVVYAQSRNRLVSPGADNCGFAAWVWTHAPDLVRLLGPGRHFGEWWGSGIQRGYGLTNGEKRFSLFNVHRYEKAFSAYYESNGNVWPELITSGRLGVVPTLHVGPFSTNAVRRQLDHLDQTGSAAAPGFMRPEGVVVFHAASGAVYKATLENDEAPKGALKAA